MATAIELVPWILLAVVLALGIVILGGMMWHFRREVLRLRSEVAARPPPVAPPPVVPPAPVVQPARPSSPMGGRYRIENEEPPIWEAQPEITAQALAAAAPSQAVLVRPITVRINKLLGSVRRRVRCTCDVEGVEGVNTFATHVADGSANPTWNFETNVYISKECSGLRFSVSEEDGGSRGDVLGEATLSTTSFFHKEAFFLDDLELVDRGRGAGGRFRADDGPGGGRSVSTGLKLQIQVLPAPWKENTTPLFKAWWSAYNSSSKRPAFGEFGLRDNWDGDVGFRFRTKTDIAVIAFGRQLVDPLRKLLDSAVVTLWSDDTRDELASATVGPDSDVEHGYAWADLHHGLRLEANKEYRLTQECVNGMPDRWFDGSVNETELRQWSAFENVEFLGSIYQGGHGFPEQVDREQCESRRAGMLNLRMIGTTPEQEASSYPLALRPGSTQAQTDEGTGDDLLQIRLVCISPSPKEP